MKIVATTVISPCDPHDKGAGMVIRDVLYNFFRRLFLPYTCRLLFFILATLTALPTSALPADWKVNPHADVLLTYDDREKNTDKPGFMYYFEPGIDITRLTERSSLQISSFVSMSVINPGAQFDNFSDAEIDRVNQNHNLQFTYDLTELSTLSFAARYSVSHPIADWRDAMEIGAGRDFGIVTDPARQGEEQDDTVLTGEEGDIDLVTEGARYSLEIPLSYKLRLSERSTAGSTYAFNKVIIEGDTPNWTSHSLRTFLSHSSSENTTWTVNVGLMASLYDSGVDQTFGSLTLGLDHSFTESLSLNIEFGLGLQQTTQSASSSGQEQSNASSNDYRLSELFNANLLWKREYYSISAFVSQSVMPSAYGENSLNTRGGLNFTWDPLEDLNLSLMLGLTQNQTQGVDDDRSQINEFIQASLGYDFTRKLNFKFVSGVKQIQTTVKNSNGDTTKFFIGSTLTYTFDEQWALILGSEQTMFQGDGSKDDSGLRSRFYLGVKWNFDGV